MGQFRRVGFVLSRGERLVMTVWRRVSATRTRVARCLLLYPRHRIDASARDLLFGLSACLWAFRRRRLDGEIVRAFPSVEDALVCFSARSGFDLLLGELGLAPGDEVLVSAVTHPDMVRIIEGR